MYIMASPSQKQGYCGHLMAGFDQHLHCAHFLDKGQESDPCVIQHDCVCDILTTENDPSSPHHPTKLKKEKKDNKSDKKDKKVPLL